MRIAPSRGKARRYAALLLTAIIVVSFGIGSGQERALSQSTAEPAYAPDHILVKFKEGTPTEAISQVERLNGTRTEDVISSINTRIVDLPMGLSPVEGVRLYEGLPEIEFAEPDYKLFPTQSDCTEGAETASYEAGPCDFVEPATYEPPPADPPSDRATVAPEPELAPLVPNDLEFTNLWGLDNTGQDVYDVQSETYIKGVPDADIDAPEAWSLTTGNADTAVAVIDKGVDINHPDLNGNIWVNKDEIPGNDRDDDGNGYVDDVNGWDFVGDDNTVYDGTSDDHGTHVAGTIAAEGDNGIGVTGVAWQAEIMPLKFIDRQPDGRVYGLLSDAAKAIEYAVAEGVKISNNSYACPRPYCDTDSERLTLELAIKKADAAGHLVVAAAGNANGTPAPSDTDFNSVDPANTDSPNVISVAATGSNDSKTPFSNYGATSVDLAAPGENVYSTLPESAYGYRDGTSMATAYVSGVAALLKSKFPDLSHRQIKDRILQSVDEKSALAGTSIKRGA